MVTIPLFSSIGLAIKFVGTIVKVAAIESKVSKGSRSQRCWESSSMDFDCNCYDCMMSDRFNYGLDANIVEHHDNYRRRYACCPKWVISFVIYLENTSSLVCTAKYSSKLCRNILLAIYYII